MRCPSLISTAVLSLKKTSVEGTWLCRAIGLRQVDLPLIYMLLACSERIVREAGNCGVIYERRDE